MNRKLLTAVTVTATTIAAVSLGLFAGGMPSADAHQRIPIGDNFIIIGHTGEPAFGAEDGEWIGKHDVQVFLRDADGNPMSDADLKVDKYYFEKVKKYNKADDITDADAIAREETLSESFRNPGEYINHQVIEDGIYGYNVYGTLADGTEIDVTAFCLADGMDDPTKFEEGEALSEFGCPRDIDDIRFPQK